MKSTKRTNTRLDWRGMLLGTAQTGDGDCVLKWDLVGYWLDSETSVFGPSRGSIVPSVGSSRRAPHEQTDS